MTQIVIDPVLLMVPDDEASRADIEAWLEALQLWLQEAASAPFLWLHYLEATKQLEENGRFPNFQQLKQIQKKYQLDVNIAQIVRLVNEFFRNEELDLESYLQQLEFEIEPAPDSILVQPVQLIARLPEFMHVNLYGLLAECCFCQYIGNEFGRDLRIATLSLENGIRSITVSMILIDAIPDVSPPADGSVTATFPLVITPDDLQPPIDVIELWDRGEQSICYAIESRRKKDLGPLASSYTFRLGTRFIESIHERGLDTNETMLRNIIRAAAYVIADAAKDQHGYKLHHLRESETAGSPQRTRAHDQARAWRLMLQKQGAGWRLHYWQISTPDGVVIEFANVGKESEREIY